FRNPYAGMNECLRVGKVFACIEPLTSRFVEVLSSVGIIARSEFGETIERFTPTEITAKFAEPSYTTAVRTYLYKSHPAIHAVLRRIDNPMLSTLVRSSYSVLDTTSAPFHTKLLAVIRHAQPD